MSAADDRRAGAESLLRRWRDDLAAWAIPKEILGRAPASPWTPERAIFIRRAASSRSRHSASYRRADEALPADGSLIDVGAGAGAASLPLLDRASALVAIDPDEPLLRELLRGAGADAARVQTVVGSWPEIAPSVPLADIVVCHHVLYNVPDLRPFVEALAAHARRRVVVEITARHPLSRLNPLWERLHGITRPSGPTWEHAAETVSALVDSVRVERETLAPEPMTGTWDELVAFTSRRLCVGPDSAAEVEAALRDIGADPADPATWTGTGREVVTLWWDAAGTAARKTA